MSYVVVSLCYLSQIGMGRLGSWLGMCGIINSYMYFI